MGGLGGWFVEMASASIWQANSRVGHNTKMAGGARKSVPLPRTLVKPNAQNEDTRPRSCFFIFWNIGEIYETCAWTLNRVF